MQQQALTFNDMQQINNELSKLNVQDCSTPIEVFNALLKYWNEMHKPVEEPKFECDEHDILPVWNKWINRAIPLNTNSMFINRIKRMYDELHNSPKCVWYIHEFTASLMVVRNDTSNPSYNSSVLIPKRKYVIIEEYGIDDEDEDDPVSKITEDNPFQTKNRSVYGISGQITIQPNSLKHFKITKISRDYRLVYRSAFSKTIGYYYTQTSNAYGGYNHVDYAEGILCRCGNNIPVIQIKNDNVVGHKCEIDGYSNDKRPSEYVIAFDSYDTRYDEFYKRLQEFILKCEEYKKDDYRLYYEENC